MAASGRSSVLFTDGSEAWTIPKTATPTRLTMISTPSSAANGAQIGTSALRGSGGGGGGISGSVINSRARV